MSARVRTGETAAAGTATPMARLTSPPRNILMATLGRATLLVGWAEISRYCRKATRTLRRYRELEAFPAFRWGRKLPRQVDTAKVDSTGMSGLGRNVSGGT